MDTTELINQLIAAAQGKEWTVVFGATILLLVYMSKLEVAGNLWEKIPKPYRPVAVLAIGVGSSVAHALVTAQPWLPVLLSGIIGALAAIGTDQVITKPLVK